ncbi:MAG: hypothetical protein WAK29_20170, partial [Terriglobales bacterium]
CRDGTIDGTRALRLRTFFERKDSYHDADGGQANQDNAGRRKITAGGTEFFADVKAGDRG